MEPTKTRWGYWQELLVEEGFRVKKLVINSEKHISLQYHNHRAECWSIVSGSGELKMIEDGAEYMMFVTELDVVTIHRGCINKVTCVSEEPLVIIETQVGHICTEEDIVRLESIEE